jgi:Uma2 family endonuclease
MDRVHCRRKKKMGVATPRILPETLTYQAYLAEGEIKARYDITDGVRTLMPGPTLRHQRVQVNTTEVLRQYEQRSGNGYVIPAPCDVVIRREPRLQTRQPDVLYVTKTQLERDGDIADLPFLSVAPELVIEIISDSEIERRVSDKIADYVSIGVREAWLLRPDTRCVEVLRLTRDGLESVGIYQENEAFTSLTFPDLIVPVALLFRL